MVTALLKRLGSQRSELRGCEFDEFISIVLLDSYRLYFHTLVSAQR